MVELAADVGISPSFPIPEILSTCIATKESFGIIPVPEKIAEELGFERRKEPVYEVNDKGNLLHRGMPVNTLTRLSTRPSPPHDYLAERQMTAHAVVPIHTNGEFKLFNDLMRSERFYKKDRKRVAAKVSQSVDFTAFAKEWTIHVHLAAAENWDKNNQIYYKLPEQLEKHHQAWVKTQGENATLSNTEKMREKFTKIVTSTSRQAIVLPAIKFPKKNLGAQKNKGKEKERTIQNGMYY